LRAAFLWWMVLKVSYLDQIYLLNDSAARLCKSSDGKRVKFLLERLLRRRSLLRVCIPCRMATINFSSFRRNFRGWWAKGFLGERFAICHFTFSPISDWTPQPRKLWGRNSNGKERNRGSLWKKLWLWHGMWNAISSNVADEYCAFVSVSSLNCLIHIRLRTACWTDFERICHVPNFL
jgi:hypothetical protein